MRAEIIIARAMIEMAKENHVIGSVNEISQRIYKYKERGEDVSSVTLQRTPMGLHSREVAEFVGRLLATEIISQADPIMIDQAGIEQLERLKEL